jgi:steroid 5-alpha reductase family enzyme
MTPLHLVLLTFAVVCAGCWILSLITKEHSWVDRMWSITPVIYVGEFARGAHFHNVRLNVMALIVLCWGARLTFNFARKGGYSGAEDYRWPVLRASMKPWQFQLFNIFFIVLYQNFLLVLISLPALTAYRHQATAFDGWDFLLVALFLLFLLGETLADQEQWDFQQTKRGIIEHGGAPEQRFLTTGLFKFARHPNYFFEIAQWWVLYLIGCNSIGLLFQRTIVGPILLTILFIGSTNFTEKLSLAKYPEYAEYQRTTSAVIPWFGKRPLRKKLA